MEKQTKFALFLVVNMVIGFTLIFCMSYYRTNFVVPPQWNQQVEPEFFSGLLTANSVILTFSFWLFSKITKNKYAFAIILVTLPLMLFIMSTWSIIPVALGTGNEVIEFTWMSDLFYASTCLIVFGYVMKNIE